MSNEIICALARTVQDVNKPEAERKGALRHLAAIRGECADLVSTIPVEDLSAVVAGMTVWARIGCHDLTLMDAADVIRYARMQRETADRRR